MGKTQEISKKKTTNTCLIDTCDKTCYCKGYCRNHYNSLLRHGDPLHAEQTVKKRRLQAEQRRMEKADKPKSQSNVGKTCKAEGCSLPARIKGHCLKHDARIKRNGTLVLKHKRSNIKVEQCVVMGCTTKVKRHGICAHHSNNIRELKSPLKPQIIKLCGVKGCDNPHMAKGMCNSHYAQWKAVVRDYRLSEYFELIGWEDDDKWKY